MKMFFEFLNVFQNSGEKSGIFNIGSVSYNVSLQLILGKNCWKNMWGTHN
jgi:hypothetical protein